MAEITPTERELSKYMWIWGVFWSSSLSDLHAKLILCCVDAAPVVPPRGVLCPLDPT